MFVTPGFCQYFDSQSLAVLSVFIEKYIRGERRHSKQQNSSSFAQNTDKVVFLILFLSPFRRHH